MKKQKERFCYDPLPKSWPSRWRRVYRGKIRNGDIVKFTINPAVMWCKSFVGEDVRSDYLLINDVQIFRRK